MSVQHPDNSVRYGGVETATFLGQLDIFDLWWDARAEEAFCRWDVPLHDEPTDDEIAMALREGRRRAHQKWPAAPKPQPSFGL